MSRVSKHPASLEKSISEGLKEIFAPKRKPNEEASSRLREPVDRGMTIVALVGHFCVQRELFGEHVVGAPAESPGEGVAGRNGSRRLLLSPKLLTFTPKLMFA